MSYERENVKQMAGYTPGEQPDDAKVIKLNTNENPYPPSEAVMNALQETQPEMLRKYPPPNALGFRRIAAGVHGVASNSIIATNGGDELLRLLITTFVEPGRPIGTAEPSYSLYPVLAAVNGSPVHRVGLNEDWSIPEDFAKQMNEAGVQVTFVVNPHAPSGTLKPMRVLDELASELDGVLVIDEAYVDFVSPEHHHSTIELTQKHENVVILRTLSKGYSLAGLRFGYGIGSVNLIEPMQTKTKDSYNTDILSQRLANAALSNRDAAGQTWLAVRSERERVREVLGGLGWSSPRSESNFILVRVPDNYGGGAKAVYESLKARDIFVRYFDQDRLRDKLRITIGTPQENDALIEAVTALG